VEEFSAMTVTQLTIMRRVSRCLQVGRLKNLEPIPILIKRALEVRRQRLRFKVVIREDIKV
jgi:hypothetical protein